MTKLQAQISEKPCEYCRGHTFVLIFIKLDQNEFVSRSCWFEKWVTSSISETLCKHTKGNIFYQFFKIFVRLLVLTLIRMGLQLCYVGSKLRSQFQVNEKPYDH